MNVKQNAKQSLAADKIGRIFAPLAAANAIFAQRYPVMPLARQPVHTVYGGAHLFKAGTIAKLGDLASAAFAQYAPQPAILASLFDLDAALAERVHQLVSEKLKREAVEDYRIDFEDGYGHRDDAEEDGHAAAAAREMAIALEERRLPAFSGMRIKALTPDVHQRAARTLDIFLTTLLETTGGALPANFVINLPKVGCAAQVSALHELLSALETHHHLQPGILRMELMMETPQALVDQNGSVALPAFVAAARGRCQAVHFGAYDYTAALELTAAHQTIDHPACTFARSLMQVSLTGTGIWLSDGATNRLPIAPHRAGTSPGALTKEQLTENTDVVHNAWRISFRDVTASLRSGFYQGWDLHPNQIPVRYAAIYAFYLSGFDIASRRLKAFIDHAAQASLLHDMFDDAASGQGLLNFFLRALHCGAVTEKDLEATGLTRSEIETRSFLSIIQMRKTAEGDWR